MQGVLERWRVGKQAVVGRLIIDTANVRLHVLPSDESMQLTWSVLPAMPMTTCTGA